MAPIRVLIVDDHTVFTEGVRLLLERDGRVTVCGTARHIAGAVHLASELRPDVVLLDQHLSGERGVDAIAPIREASPSTAVVVLTGLAPDDAVVPAIEAGAAGVLEKVIHPHELVDAIERAAEGETLFSPSTVRDAVRRAQAASFALGAGASARLTERERQVLDLLAQACDSKTIAARLGLSVHTVRDHTQNVLEKLGAHSRMEAVLRAGRLGLLRQAG